MFQFEACRAPVARLAISIPSEGRTPGTFCHATASSPPSAETARPSTWKARSGGTGSAGQPDRMAGAIQPEQVEAVGEIT